MLTIIVFASVASSTVANSIKQSGEGPALQVTRPARSAGLAEEADGEDLRGPERWSDLADVRVYGFDQFMVIVDRDPDAVAVEDVVELVTSAAKDLGSIYEAHPASIRPAGNGCMVSLPGLAPTGLSIGDRAPVTPAPGMLFVSDGSRDRSRLARDLESIRQSQVTNAADSR